MLPTSAEVLEQDVSDYIWMLDHGPANDNSPRDDLTDWISTLHVADTGNPASPYSDTAAIAHSIAKWKQTSSLPWLVAALSEIPASDPNAPSPDRGGRECKARFARLRNDRISRRAAADGTG